MYATTVIINDDKTCQKIGDEEVSDIWGREPGGQKNAGSLWNRWGSEKPLSDEGLKNDLKAADGSYKLMKMRT